MSSRYAIATIGLTDCKTWMLSTVHSRRYCEFLPSPVSGFMWYLTLDIIANFTGLLEVCKLESNSEYTMSVSQSFGLAWWQRQNLLWPCWHYEAITSDYKAVKERNQRTEWVSRKQRGPCSLGSRLLLRLCLRLMSRMHKNEQEFSSPLAFFLLWRGAIRISSETQKKTSAWHYGHFIQRPKTWHAW